MADQWGAGHPTATAVHSNGFRNTSGSSSGIVFCTRMPDGAGLDGGGGAITWLGGAVSSWDLFPHLLVYSGLVCGDLVKRGTVCSAIRRNSLSPSDIESCCFAVPSAPPGSAGALLAFSTICRPPQVRRSIRMASSGASGTMGLSWHSIFFQSRCKTEE